MILSILIRSDFLVSFEKLVSHSLRFSAFFLRLAGSILWTVNDLKLVRMAPGVVVLQPIRRGRIKVAHCPEEIKIKFHIQTEGKILEIGPGDIQT